MKFNSVTEAEAWVRATAKTLRRPAVVLLSGGLGAGKTQFVRWFLNELGVNETASPTFAIHHEYPSVGGSIDHVDLYRVENEADLEATGFWDLFAQPQGLVFVEWADRLPADVWPKTWQQIHIQLENLGGEARELTLKS